MSSRKKVAPSVSPFEESLQNLPLDEAPIEARVLTVNGKPIPPHFAHAIPYAHTDQGIAEQANNGKPRAYTTVVRDAWDKQMDKRAAATEVWESNDPLVDAVDSVREAGMGYRFLSPRVISKRGKRKYEIVKDEKGDPVSVGNMVLGKMPLDMQERRARHYQDLGNDDLRQAYENLRVEQESVLRDNPGIGNPMLKPGDHLVDRGYGNASGEAYEVGIQRNRGQVAA